jgi:uncharacterized membrane protein YkvA (DUF1232 family)
MHRILQFRNELMTLWRAFIAPGTPLWLKGLMLLVPLYLISPADLIPDIIPVLGWVDDLVIIPLLVTWLVSLLPQAAAGRGAYRANPADTGDGPTIDGTARRL